MCKGFKFWEEYKMKKKKLVGATLLLATLALSACGNQSKASNVHSESSVSKNSHKQESKVKAEKKKATKKKEQLKSESSKKISESSKKAQEQKIASESTNSVSVSEKSAVAAKSTVSSNVEASSSLEQSKTEQQVNNTEQGSAATASNSVATSKPAPAAPTPATSKVLGVPFISQGSTMLCEGSSLLEALHYKGVTSQGINQFVNSMPKSSNNNPYNGYAGEWRHNVDGTYQGMMAGPVVQWANSVGGHATQISGPSAIKNSIRNGNPVVAWIVYDFAAPQFKQMPWGRAVWNGHVICVDGFNQSGYHIVDPNAGSYWVSAATFENANAVTGMAVSVS